MSNTIEKLVLDYGGDRVKKVIEQILDCGEMETSVTRNGYHCGGRRIIHEGKVRWQGVLTDQAGYATDAPGLWRTESEAVARASEYVNELQSGIADRFE